jgi:hypothetical protein
MTSVSGQAQWVLIGGKNYDFNPVPLSQGDAKVRCIREGGKLFEPKDAKTNQDVFDQAGTILGQQGGANRNLWIGVSDTVTDLEFTYLSDESLVNFICQGSDKGTTGCWLAEPESDAASGTDTDCVTGSSGSNGKWTNQVCTSAFGSICESAGKAPPPPVSGSTCLESGTAVLLLLSLGFA